MEAFTHREAKFGHSLCGKALPVSAMTLDDIQVTCPDCLRVLQQIKRADSKTKLLKRMFYQEE